MLKKGGIFLCLLLCTTLAFAEDNIDKLFHHDNPNLINLNEAKEYDNEPLVYIEGVKAPEKANNDIEELQLKLFGTKNVKEATKNTLELSPSQLPAAPENQVRDFVFQSPFNQTIRSAFIPHKTAGHQRTHCSG